MGSFESESRILMYNPDVFLHEPEWEGGTIILFEYTLQHRMFGTLLDSAHIFLVKYILKPYVEIAIDPNNA